jgi:tetratricopeptide (TPR) repeat protein
VILAAMLALRRFGDADTWWHLAAGRWIAEHHAVPRTDTLSYTVPDHAWIDLQWLFDLFIYTLHRAGGPSLVVLAGAVLYAAGIALLLKNLRLALGPVAAAVVGLWVVAIAQGRFTIRPEMASFIFLQIVLWACTTGLRTGGRRLWLLPVVMVVWVNTHSLFVIGAFVVGCYMAASVANHLSVVPRAWRQSMEPRATRTMLLSGTLALLATLVNPYGLEGALLPVKLMTRLSGEAPAFQLIGELRRSFSPEAVSLAVRAYQAFFFFSLAVVGAAVLVATFGREPRSRERRPERRRKRQLNAGERGDVRDGQAAEAKRAGLDLAGLAIFAALAYLSTLARRNMALFALVTAPFVGQCLALLGRHLSALARRSEARDGWAAAAVAGLLPALVLAGWFVASNNFYRLDAQPQQFGTGIFEAGSPVKAAAFVKEQKLPPPLYNDWTSGGYLTWAQPVPGGVYIDSRGEVYDDQFFSDYLARLRQPALWQDDADHMGFQTVIFFHLWASHRHLLTWLLRDPRWALVYFDENATVFVRREGNEALIARATRAFEPLREQNARALLEPGSSWQWPVDRARGLLAYGALLDVMGRSGEAVQFFSRLLEIGPSRKEESHLAVRLAHHHASRGETERARAYLERAVQADPDNPGIAPLRKRIGG